MLINAKFTYGRQIGSKVCWKLQFHPGQQNVAKHDAHPLEDVREVQGEQFSLECLEVCLALVWRQDQEHVGLRDLLVTNWSFKLLGDTVDITVLFSFFPDYKLELLPVSWLLVLMKMSIFVQKLSITFNTKLVITEWGTNINILWTNEMVHLTLQSLHSRIVIRKLSVSRGNVKL